MKKITKNIITIIVIMIGITTYSSVFANTNPIQNNYLNGYGWTFGVIQGTTEDKYTQMVNNVIKYYGSILQDSRYQWVIGMTSANNFHLFIWDDYIINPQPWGQPIGVVGSTIPYISTSGWSTVANANQPNKFIIGQERTINYNNVTGQSWIQEETIKMSAYNVVNLHSTAPYTRVLGQNDYTLPSVLAGRFYYNGVCIPGDSDQTSCPIMYNSPLLDWQGNITLSDEATEIKTTLDKQIDAVNKTTDTIKDDTVDNSQYNDFFSGFEVNGHGITSIITAPLVLLNHLTQNNCVPLNLSLPYVNSNIALPCADSVMNSMIGTTSWNFFRTISTGIISYKVLVDLLSFINNMRNPDNDNIEVIDL